jgi:polyribonucleotide nucleotidyltransferase
MATRRYYRQQKKPIMLKVELFHVKIRREKMIEKGLFLTGCDAELLDRALSEVKTKAYEESEAQLDDTQALYTLVSHYRNARNDSQEKEIHNSFFSPLRKRLVLGTIIDRQVSADSRKV